MSGRSVAVTTMFLVLVGATLANLVPHTPEHKTYSMKGGFLILGDATKVEPGLNEHFRDNINNRTRFRASLAEWAKPHGWTHHVDLVVVENGQLVNYFWYETTEGGVANCIRKAWQGSSSRTPFYNAFELPPNAIHLGRSTERGVEVECYSGEVHGYGTVRQCYRIGEDTIPMTFEGTGSCCPGANRWDFYDFQRDVELDESLFAVPLECAVPTPAPVALVPGAPEDAKSYRLVLALVGGPTSSAQGPGGLLMEHRRDYTNDRARWAAAYGNWYDPGAGGTHVDVVMRVNGRLVNYFWNESPKKKVSGCKRAPWHGSSHRTFFRDVYETPENWTPADSIEVRGQATQCYKGFLGSYGPVSQCYGTAGNLLVPMLFQGECQAPEACPPGPNRFEFHQMEFDVDFSDEDFALPECEWEDVAHV